MRRICAQRKASRRTKQSFDDLLCAHKTGWGEEAGPEAEGERGGGPLGGLSFPGL